jgi:group II intron reverse transcriptase/maturase
LIPKPGKPGKFRPLGIPTLKDRLVQMALKTVLEPIFEADFYVTSYGFRRGRSTMDALAMIQRQLQPTSVDPSRVEYIIEGDIKGCFDNIDHHLLMERIRKRVKDRKALRLILSFLKAGIMAEGNVRHPVTGAPQGGIISPLMSNIYLTAIEERYARWIPCPGEPLWKAQKRRQQDRMRGQPTCYLVRYADDFVVLMSGSREDAKAEKSALAEYIQRELRMELSMEKTLVTHAEEGFNFLGYRVVRELALRTGRLVCKLRIPKEKLQRLRDKLKAETCRKTTGYSLERLLRGLNRQVAGWRNYYQYAAGAASEFSHLDWWLWQRVQQWMKRKHKESSTQRIRREYTQQVTPRRWTWAENRTRLRSFNQGGTKRYICRGTRISNRWA